MQWLSGLFLWFLAARTHPLSISNISKSKMLGKGRKRRDFHFQLSFFILVSHCIWMVVICDAGLPLCAGPYLPTFACLINIGTVCVWPNRETRLRMAELYLEVQRSPSSCYSQCSVSLKMCCSQCRKGSPSTLVLFLHWNKVQARCWSYRWE